MDTGPAGWGWSLYGRVLDAVGAGPGGSLLDVGCGTGQLCRLAVDRGAWVTGVDSDPVQLARAAELVPEAALCRADLLALPFADATAASVSCVQVLMHVPNPLAAMRELTRVATPGASVAITVWGPPERCAIGLFGRVLAPLLGGSASHAAPASVFSGAPRPGPRPFGPAQLVPRLSTEGRLARLAGLAGLRVLAVEDVACWFDYPDERALLASLYASELGRRAVEAAGRARVRRAVLAGLAECRWRDGYRLENTFWLLRARA